MEKEEYEHQEGGACFAIFYYKPLPKNGPGNTKRNGTNQVPLTYIKGKFSIFIPHFCQVVSPRSTTIYTSNLLRLGSHVPLTKQQY